MVGLGTIFLDIVRDNPTIKNKIVERAFCYIISGLGCVCQFTDLHKKMCGCTKCNGLHMLHCSLQAKCSVMQPDCNWRSTLHNKSAGQGDGEGLGQFCVTYNAIGSNQGGHLHLMECAWRATLGVSNALVRDLHHIPCASRGGMWGCRCQADLVSCIQVYSLVASGWQVALRSQACSKEGYNWQVSLSFYVPVLGCNRYHMTNNRLAAQCHVERRTIMRGSVSLHCNYGKRLGLSFKEEIQSRYCQNTLVSVEGALLE